MNTWKGVALTIIGLLLLIMLFNLFRPVAPETKAMQDNQAGYDAYMDELRKKNEAYYKKTDDLMNRAGAINDLSLNNQKRYEQLLERWEKQADHMDKVIARLEKSR